MNDIVERLRAVQGDNEDAREAAAAIARLRAALQNLLECSGHLSVFGGNPSVKAVRQAGKYIKAVDAARSALEPKP